MAQSKNFPDCFHRVSVKALVVRDGKILLLKESEKLSGQWELPGGGLDFGEDIHEALKREVKEETGIPVKTISKRPLYVWTWKISGKRDLDWYYTLVLGYQVELEHFNFTTTEECEEIGFFSPEELTKADLCWQTNGLKKFFNPQDFA